MKNVAPHEMELEMLVFVADPLLQSFSQNASLSTQLHSGRERETETTRKKISFASAHSKLTNANIIPVNQKNLQQLLLPYDAIHTTYRKTALQSQEKQSE